MRIDDEELALYAAGDDDSVTSRMARDLRDLRLATQTVIGRPHAEVAAEIAPVSVTCSTCNDTHVMELSYRDAMGARVPCTRCPTPCEACRGRTPGCGPSAYCATTPCACDCHDETRVSNVEYQDAERILVDVASANGIDARDSLFTDEIISADCAQVRR